MQTTMTDKTIRLPDGRHLGYAEYGDPQGMPLLFFHGTPGSRLRLSHIGPLARDVGVRVLAPERPGFGLSAFQPKRTLLDWVQDVEVLADRLGERLARSGPWAVNLLMRNMARGTNNPERFRKQFMSRLPPVDAATLKLDEVWNQRLADFREAFRNGTRGASWDLVLVARPWGFRLEEIQIPTSLWHGEVDTTIPVALARAVARAIPNCQATFVPGEGHLSLFLKYEEEILRSFCTREQG